MSGPALSTVSPSRVTGWVLQARGTGPACVTGGRNAKALATPLPDVAGAQLAFVDPDGRALRVLPITQAGCVDANPAFTADGRRVVYVNDCPTEAALYSRAVDGSGEPQRITPPGPDGYDEPNPSPDSRLLSYIRVENRVEFQQALTVSRVDGTDPRDLLPPSA